MYRVVEKKGSFYIQKETLGIWITLRHPTSFPTQGDAQSYINEKLNVS